MPDQTNGQREERLLTAGRLAANLAHDWNNFLTIFAAHAAELAAAAPGNPAVQTIASEMRQSIEHASDFPRRLLGWLRQEPGVRGTLCPNQVIETAFPLIEKTAGSAAHCQLDLSPDLPSISLDAAQLINTLLNLASNSAQAMERRGVIVIRTRQRDECAVISVEDNGRGMTVAVRDRIQEPFFTTRAANGGTGLGMVAVRRFVDDHSGRITIDSAPGQGTRIQIALPYSTDMSTG